MTPSGDDDGNGVTGALRRAVGAAYDATVGRVGEAALEITDNTARQVIEELEPYLIEEAIPRILEGITPYLEKELVPEIVDALVPHINESVAPQVIEAVTPMIIEEVAPRVIEAMLPDIIDEVAPAVIKGVLPQIIDEVAPAVIEGVMPMIQAEVVPAIMDDIVDDPRVRQLIREQSAGLVLDALERVRRALSRADDTVENIVRWATRRGPRLAPPAGQLQAPVGRSYPYAGFITRGAALIFDLSVLGFLVGSGIAMITRLVESWVDPVPSWVTVSLALVGFSVAPTYFALCWVWFGQTVGDGIFGARLSRVEGGRMRLVPAFIKAFVGVLLLPLWVLGMLTSAFNTRRQGLLDILTRTDSTYLSRELWVPPPESEPAALGTGTGTGTGTSTGTGTGTSTGTSTGTGTGTGMSTGTGTGTGMSQPSITS